MNKQLVITISKDADGTIHTSIPQLSKELTDLELFMCYKHIELLLNQSGFDWTVGQRINLIKEENKNGK